MGLKSKHVLLASVEDHEQKQRDQMPAPPIKPQTMVRELDERNDLLLDSKLHLEGVGPLNVILSSKTITWQGIGRADHDEDDVACHQELLSCFKEGTRSKRIRAYGSLPLNEIYAVEKIGYGAVVASKLSASVEGLISQVPQACGPVNVDTSLRQRAFGARTKRRNLPIATTSEQLRRRMLFYRFVVHTFERAEDRSGQWIPREYLFGHESEDVCNSWMNRIKDLLAKDQSRPRKLLVIINPYGGRKQGIAKWKQVAPIFDRAGIETEVITTTHRGHAHEIMATASDEELLSRDGVVVVGGDGLFNEVLNGLAMKRHSVPPAPMPYKRKKTGSPQTTTRTSPGNWARDALLPVHFRTKSNRIVKLVTSLYEKQDNLADSEPRGMISGKSNAFRPVPTSPRNLENVTNVTSHDDETSPLSNWSVEALPVPVVSGDGDEKDGYRKLPSSNLNRLVEQGQEHSLDVERGSASGNGGVGLQNVYTATDNPTAYAAAESFRTEPVMSTDSPSQGENLGRDTPGLVLAPDLGLTLNKRKLRIGIIPAGSTDTIVISTTGSRDPITAALHIVLGDRMPLDIARITSWKSSRYPNKDEKRAGPTQETPVVRYAASFCGYGFYGDVARESEEFRWMGPARYDYAGFMTYLRHREYEAEVSYLEMPSASPGTEPAIPHGPWPGGAGRHKRRNVGRVICRAECVVCAAGRDFSHLSEISSDEEAAGVALQGPKWRTVRGRFHSIGAAVMSCRNDKAPDGVAAHAHLADGQLHLILIRECSRVDYLLQLLRLTWKGADPLDFNFVDYHKTPAFTFISHGKESVWNVDGELFPAHQLSAQVFRGLVDLFARGPEN